MIDRAEPERRCHDVVRELDDRMQLPEGWTPPWKGRTERRVRRSPRTPGAWDALRNRIADRQRRDDDSKNLDSSLKATLPHLPRRVKDTAPEHLEALMRARDANGSNLSSQRKYRQLLLEALRAAVDSGLLDEAELPRLKRAATPITVDRQRKQREMLVDHQTIETSLNHLAPHWRKAVRLSLWTAARPSDLFDARIRDIDHDDRGNRGIVPESHKLAHRGRRRRIPLVERAWELIEAEIHSRPADQHILRLPDGRPLRYSALDEAVRRTAKRHGFERYSAYQLRHTAITDVIRTKGTLAASRIAGHASPHVTMQVYAPVFDEDTIAAAEALEEAHWQRTGVSMRDIVEDLRAARPERRRWPPLPTRTPPDTFPTVSTPATPLVDLIGALNDLEAKFAPEAVFVRGDTSVLQHGPRIAVVGSREASPVGMDAARAIAGDCARRGLVVVSGLAKGIDTSAHLGALEAAGRTIAVLGTPLERAYPKENRALQERIGRQHLLMSQFEAGSRVWPGNFPARNKLMVLVADALLVVEAGEQSGTKDQAWSAVRVGTPVLIHERLAAASDVEWVNKVLEYGGEVVSSVDDVLAALHLVSPALDA